MVDRSHGLREWYNGEVWPMKTLLIFADQDEIVVPRPVSRIAKLLPHAEGHWVRNAPHHLVVESAQTVCHCITDFSARNGGDEDHGQWPLKYRVLHLLCDWLTTKKTDIVFDNLGTLQGTMTPTEGRCHPRSAM